MPGAAALTLDLDAANTSGAATFLHQAARAGFCAHPVRLEGSITHARINRHTGELVAAREAYTTDTEPGGQLLKACGNRRASRCPACAEVYRADAYQLVRAGLAGGKGLPTTVATHPRLFVTFTAPGFGPVHTQHTKNGKHRPCRPRHPAKRCPHGRPAACRRRHPDGDPLLGQPICPACFDYQAAVLWNAVAPELWRRTSDYTKRYLARLTRLSLAELQRTVRVSFTKVAEYQHRGLIHYHAVIRLDATPPPDDLDVVAPPPEGFTTDLLAAAIRLAAHGGTLNHRPVPAAAAPVPAYAAHPDRRAVWGAQLDIRPIRQPGAGETTAEQVAGYIAKYATKGTESFGPALDHRIRTTRQLVQAERELSPHIAALLDICWQLGADPALQHLRLRQWAHMLGFGGHWTTKSRRYSVTMGPAPRKGHLDRPPARPARPAGRRPGRRPHHHRVARLVVSGQRLPDPRRGHPRRRDCCLHPRAAPPRSGCPRYRLNRRASRGVVAVESLLTVDQAAEAMGTSPRFIRRLIAERRIAYTKLGRHVRIAESDLINYVTAGRIEASA